MQLLQLADVHHMFPKSGIEAAIMQTVHMMLKMLYEQLYFVRLLLVFLLIV